MILYSPNGTGKSHFFKNEVIPSFDYSFLYFSISDFVNMKEDVFAIITEFFRQVINKIKPSLIDRPMTDVFVINKFKDYYDLLMDMTGLFHVYFVIDDIADIVSFGLYKKNLRKFLEVSLLFPEINFVLISSFDLKLSELNFSFNFDSFVSLHIFSHLSSEKPSSKEIENITTLSPLNVDHIKNVYYSKMKINSQFDRIGGSFYSNWIGQLLYYSINLNEFIYSLGTIKQSLETHSISLGRSSSNFFDSKKKNSNSFSNSKLETRINQAIKQSAKVGLIKTKNIVTSLSMLSLDPQKTDDADFIVNNENKSKFKENDAKQEKQSHDQLLCGKQIYLFWLRFLIL